MVPSILGAILDQSRSTIERMRDGRDGHKKMEGWFRIGRRWFILGRDLKRFIEEQRRGSNPEPSAPPTPSGRLPPSGAAAPLGRQEHPLPQGPSHKGCGRLNQFRYRTV